MVSIYLWSLKKFSSEYFSYDAYKNKDIDTEDPHYNDSVCYQRFCCKFEFAVIRKLDMDPSRA